jgi:putative ABC transport system permease protein
LINIAGLTIGLTACLLVATVVLDDLSYDHHWKNSNDIYRIITINKSNKNAVEKSSQSYTGLGPSLKKDFPEVKEYCRMWATKHRFKIGTGKDGVIINSLSAEPSVWNVLDFKILEGKPQSFVQGYKNLVITEKFKNQYFGNDDPVGRTLTNMPEFGKAEDYIITGVIKNIPSNSFLRADVIEIHQFNSFDDILQAKGYGSFTEQYLLLKPSTHIGAFTGKVNKWLANYVTNKQMRYSLYLQPLKDIYLRSTELSGYSPIQGDIHNVYIFSGVAVLLLVIACINFVNLTTARALKRVQEAGIRKVLGADKAVLIAQFLFESLLFFFISFVLAMVLYSVFLKYVEIYLGHSLTLALQSNVFLLAATSGAVLIVSILTGIYPAFLISAQNPASTLKGKISTSIGSNLLRRGLVVLQFTISVVILVVTVIVQSQLHFMDNKDLGFDKNNLLHLNEISWEGKGNAFKQQVLALSGVENVTVTSWYPSCGSGGYMSATIDDPTQRNNKIKAWYINADFDFISTLKLHVNQGRALDSKFSSDAVNTDSLMAKNMDALQEAQSKQSVIMSSFTAKILNIKELNNRIKGIQGIPVGVVNDFNNESLKTDMKPVFITASRSVDYGSMLIRVHPGSEKQIVASLYKIWQKTFPDKVFQYDWIDNLLQDQYKNEHKLQQLFTVFSFLILSLAALGLFGLTTFMADLRVKEIGIRKVLGASATSISALLSKDFIKLVLLAILIASPIAWFFMNKWLQNYAYRIQMDWWIFALSGLFAIIIAVVTISYQTIKSATANPVKSLRSE